MTEGKKGLSIYVTHGGASTIKGTAKQLEKIASELQIIAIYSNDTYTIIKIGDNLLEVVFDLDGFIQFVNSFKMQRIVNAEQIRICCDANLAEIGGHFVSTAVNTLLTTIKPQEVILFSSTPQCASDAESYLKGLPCKNNFLIPLEIKYGFYADRDSLRQSIADKHYHTRIGHESNLMQPTLKKTCYSKFRDRFWGGRSSKVHVTNMPTTCSDPDPEKPQTNIKTN